MSANGDEAKISDVIPDFIDRAVNFTASTQAFREYLHKSPQNNSVPAGIDRDKVSQYFEHLAYYRDIYQPVDKRR